MRLLVVEDDPDLNRQLATALTDAGYVVDRAFDGEEGHFLGDSEPYDAVVLDIGLPKMDGISVLQKAAEIDPVAATALALNAALNQVTVRVHDEDLTAAEPREVARDWDVVLAGDVFYERAMAAAVEPWLRGLARAGVRVLFADPGRAYVPKSGLAELGRYVVPTTRELEDREARETVVYALTA